MKHPVQALCTFLMLMILGCSVHAADFASREIENLKQSVLDINKEMSDLEQQLLYPNTHVGVFLSVSVGTPIRLVDVNLQLNGKNLAYHFYSDQEFLALTKGGIHRVFNGNLASGEHTLKVTITGYDPQGKDYQRTTAYKFVKLAGRKLIELAVVDDLEIRQHKFVFKEWDE